MQLPLPYGILMIDSTITVGNIIEICVLLGGGAIFLIKQSDTVKYILSEVKTVKDDIKDLKKLATDTAVINNRIANLEEDFRELKHGRGFVQNGLNGEWGEQGKVK